jgi:hypothetical protein
MLRDSEFFISPPPPSSMSPPPGSLRKPNFNQHKNPTVCIQEVYCMREENTVVFDVTPCSLTVMYQYLEGNSLSAYMVSHPRRQ